MKSYLVQIMLDGEVTSKMMTERELAEHWETEDLAGCGFVYSAFDVDTFGVATPINVYETAQRVLEEKREIDQEFWDYCEAVNEYGYDGADSMEWVEMEG